MTPAWLCAPAKCIVHISPAIVGAWIALHPLPADCGRCAYAIPPAAFAPSGPLYREHGGDGLPGGYAGAPAGGYGGFGAGSGFSRDGAIIAAAVYHSSVSESPTLLIPAAFVPPTSDERGKPVPEPASVALFGAALVILGGVLAWKRRERKHREERSRIYGSVFALKGALETERFLNDSLRSALRDIKNMETASAAFAARKMAMRAKQALAR